MTLDCLLLGFEGVDLLLRVEDVVVEHLLFAFVDPDFLVLFFLFRHSAFVHVLEHSVAEFEDFGHDFGVVELRFGSYLSENLEQRLISLRFGEVACVVEMGRNLSEDVLSGLKEGDFPANLDEVALRLFDCGGGNVVFVH